MTSPLSILVFGAGAIGTYVGGSLALAGHRVTFIEQPKMAYALRQHGMHLELINARKEKRVAEVTSFSCFPSVADALKHGPFDFAIFALKSFDTAAALETIKPFADHMPPVLCLQNGVENEPELAAVLGEDNIISGTVTSSVGRRGPGDIILERLRGVGVADGHPLSLFIWQVLHSANVNPVFTGTPWT